MLVPVGPGSPARATEDISESSRLTRPSCDQKLFYKDFPGDTSNADMVSFLFNDVFCVCSTPFHFCYCRKQAFQTP